MHQNPKWYIKEQLHLMWIPLRTGIFLYVTKLKIEFIHFAFIFLKSTAIFDSKEIIQKKG